mmetsp:Transcript_20901/g.41440  ORF Transcript_20901/g.41440 Transcript_20901/m.41440 type:complete len:254 (-) Transcript_20901:16-777(-)
MPRLRSIATKSARSRSAWFTTNCSGVFVATKGWNLTVERLSPSASLPLLPASEPPLVVARVPTDTPPLTPADVEGKVGEGFARRACTSRCFKSAMTRSSGGCAICPLPLPKALVCFSLSSTYTTKACQWLMSRIVDRIAASFNGRSARITTMKREGRMASTPPSEMEGTGLLYGFATTVHTSVQWRMLHRALEPREPMRGPEVPKHPNTIVSICSCATTRSTTSDNNVSCVPSPLCFPEYLATAPPSSLLASL